MTTHDFDIICIGSVLWDVIGRAPVAMRQGSDVGGRITRLPGGVAMNIAMTLAGFGLRPALLTYIGQDDAGDALMAACAGHGMETQFVERGALPTDQYMAVEGTNGLIAAIADAHSLEAAGAGILDALRDGRIATTDTPFEGLIALDGNFTESLLAQIATSPAFASAGLRIAPASPGKAGRLQPFVNAGRGTLYVNLEEARTLAGTSVDDVAAVAAKLLDQGAARVIITNGAEAVVDATAQETLCKTPPNVTAKRVTGAGDTFMAAHIAAEANGRDRADALHQALSAAAFYVSGENAK